LAVPPEQPDTRSSLLLQGVVHQHLHALFRFGYAAALLHHIHIVKTVKLHPQFAHKLKGRIHFIFGALHRVRGSIPGKYLGARPEGVAAGVAEAVPVGHRKAKVLLHGFACHHALSIIIAKSQRIVALLSFKRNLADVFEIRFVSC